MIDCPSFDRRSSLSAPRGGYVDRLELPESSSFPREGDAGLLAEGAGSHVGHTVWSRALGLTSCADRVVADDLAFRAPRGPMGRWWQRGPRLPASLSVASL